MTLFCFFNSQTGSRDLILEHFLHNSKPVREVYMVSEHVSEVRWHFEIHTFSEIILRGELGNFLL